MVIATDRTEVDIVIGGVGGDSKWRDVSHICLPINLLKLLAAVATAVDVLSGVKAAGCNFGIRRR